MSHETDVVTISGKEFDDLLDRLDQADEEIETMKANGSTAAFDKVNDQLAEANRENSALRAELDRTKGEMERVKPLLSRALHAIDGCVYTRVGNGALLDALRAALERKADA